MFVDSINAVSHRSNAGVDILISLSFSSFSSLLSFGSKPTFTFQFRIFIKEVKNNTFCKVYKSKLLQKYI